MALSFTKTCIAAGLILAFAGPAQARPPLDGPDEGVDMTLAPECRVPGGRLYAVAPLRAVRAIVAEKRPLKVLALGSAGATTGIGSGTARATYLDQLDAQLERALGAGDVTVEQRELHGEVTAQATERIGALVTDVAPDLIVWQVGTSDALAKVDLEGFAAALNEVLEWLSSHEIDVVLVEPPYFKALAGDEHYRGLVAAIQKTARENRVPLVLRFEAMEFLAQQAARDGRTHQFKLSHLAARCIAEYVARTVALSAAAPDERPSR